MLDDLSLKPFQCLQLRIQSFYCVHVLGIFKLFLLLKYNQGNPFSIVSIPKRFNLDFERLIDERLVLGVNLLL